MVEGQITIEEYDTGNTKHKWDLKRMKLEDFRKLKIPITTQLLKNEGFTFEEIERIMGKTDLKKIDIEEEVEYV